MLIDQALELADTFGTFYLFMENIPQYLKEFMQCAVVLHFGCTSILFARKSYGMSVCLNKIDYKEETYCLQLCKPQFQVFYAVLSELKVYMPCRVDLGM